MAKSTPIENLQQNNTSQSNNELVNEILNEINSPSNTEVSNNTQEPIQMGEVYEPESQSNFEEEPVTEEFVVQPNNQSQPILDENFLDEQIKLRLQQKELLDQLNLDSKEPSQAQAPVQAQVPSEKPNQDSSKFKEHFEKEINNKNTKMVSLLQSFVDKLKSVSVVVLLVTLLSLTICDTTLTRILPDKEIITNNSNIILSILKGLIAGIVFLSISFVL